MAESGHRQGYSQAIAAEQRRSAELAKRDPELRRLGRDPQAALLQWKRLKADEQSRVVFYMMGPFDVSFALHFKEEANKSGRPELTHSITNSWEVTPESLTGKGYQLRRTFGNCEIWVNPAGREVWRLPPPKAAEPVGPTAPVSPGVPTPSPTGPQNADIIELGLVVAESQASADQLVRKSGDLKRQWPGLSPQDRDQKSADF